jgi:hypothetical protein
LLPPPAQITFLTEKSTWEESIPPRLLDPSVIHQSLDLKLDGGESTCLLLLGLAILDPSVALSIRRPVSLLPLNVI